MPKKNTLFLGIGLVIIILLFIVIYIFAVNNEQDKEQNYETISIYFTNVSTSILECEKRNIPITNNLEEKIDIVFKEYLNGPKNTNLSAVSTKIDMRDIVSITYPYNNSSATVGINLTNHYNELTTGKQLLLISSLVYTFTELDFIEDTEILLNNQPLLNASGSTVGNLSKENILNNPSFVPEKINRQNVVLYYSNGAKLEQEDRSIQVKQSQALEYQIVEQLIIGPYSKNLKATIPTDTKIKDIKTEEDICYVNLSAEFISRASADVNDKLTAIYSIVNSLTELENVSKVQFLIEGEKVTEFPGHTDFSKTFERNENLIDY